MKSKEKSMAVVVPVPLKIKIQSAVHVPLFPVKFDGNGYQSANANLSGISNPPTLFHPFRSLTRWWWESGTNKWSNKVLKSQGSIRIRCCIPRQPDNECYFGTICRPVPDKVSKGKFVSLSNCSWSLFFLCYCWTGLGGTFLLLNSLLLERMTSI